MSVEDVEDRVVSFGIGSVSIASFQDVGVEACFSPPYTSAVLTVLSGSYLACRGISEHDTCYSDGL